MRKKLTLAATAASLCLLAAPSGAAFAADAPPAPAAPLAHAAAKRASVLGVTPVGSQSNPVLTGDIIVKLKSDGPSQRSAAFAKVQAAHGIKLSVKRPMADGKHLVVRGAQRDNVLKAVDNLRKQANVESADPDVLVRALGTATDPYFTQYQWSLLDTTPGMNAVTAWDSTRGAGTTVAVVDTGVLPHGDLQANLLPGYDFISGAATANDGDGRDADPTDPGDATAAGECSATSTARRSSWHGTHVSGIIAAVANNGTGVAGVASDSKVIPVRALGKCGGSMSDIADGITWASGGTVTGVPAISKKADVVNLSLGGAGSCYSYVQNAIDGAKSRGVTVVVAAGNENQDAANVLPANCNNVITVGATGNTGTKASYSNYGSKVTLSAPGGENTGTMSGAIISTANNGTTAPLYDSYVGMIGTSQATPHVAATVALMKAVNPGLTPDAMKTLLVNNTHPFASAQSVAMGSGILDAGKAVAAAKGYVAPAPAPAPAPVAAPVAVNDSFTLPTSYRSVKLNVLANDKLTASASSLTLSGAPCSKSFCVKVAKDKSLTVTKATSYRGTTSFQYTVTQSNGQKATALVTITV